MKIKTLEKAFEIGSLNKRKKQAIVYSTNYLRMEEYMNEVALFLKEKSFRGKVIFDLLLSNGNSFNRFIEVFFNGDNFDSKTIKVINNIDDNIINKSLDFYNSHLSLLENSVLSKAQKFLIKKKFSISH
jgi:hypothetical protein